MLRWWRGHRLVTTVVVGAALGVLSGVALAQNAHTASYIAHGLGDGTDADYHVHPYCENAASTGDLTCDLSLRRAESSGYTFIAYSSASDVQHVHIDWDTYPYAECRYYVKLFGHHDNPNAGLTEHSHGHHYFCG